MNLREVAADTRARCQQIDEQLAELQRKRQELLAEKQRLTTEADEIEEYLRTKGAR